MSAAPHDEPLAHDGPAPQPGHLNRPLDGPRQHTLLIAVQIGAALWLAYHLLVPLRYYALPEHDVYDERFAWRMFSAVREQRCEVTIEQTVLGQERRVNLTTMLPMPWIALVRRNRPAVQHAVLEHLCEGPLDPSAAVITSECTTLGGERAPTLRRAIDCTSGEITESRANEGDAQ